MVKQEKDYIGKQKKKYFIYILISTAVILAFFIFGIVLTGGRENIFTLASCFLVIMLALHISRLISYMKFKDGNAEYAEQLEQMKGSYNIFHSAIIPDVRATIMIEHIVVTSKSIYFLTQNEDVLKKNRLWLENRLVAKGIYLKAIHFIRLTDLISVKNAVSKIEKDALVSDNQLNEYTQIIEELLM